MMGPSSNDKTTLLIALECHLSGTITFNGQPFSNAMKRKIGFVTHDDVLYPHLTLALLRCQNSIIGGQLERGVYGGERKWTKPPLKGWFPQCVGFAPWVAMNPTDFLLDLANGVAMGDTNEDQLPLCGQSYQPTLMIVVFFQPMIGVGQIHGWLNPGERGGQREDCGGLGCCPCPWTPLVAIQHRPLARPGLFVLLYSVMCTQGLGFAIGVAVMDEKSVVTLGAIIVITFLPRI
ncbi:hypothetical protein SASPL_109012 [Salvia splendens]|uniref:Uncharacterized protein n=1 Tax=Salvia splendens TaxID=180675 RepID=A0A8X8YJU7_SALSN|nr:hypothetical protein SASPL_109012 [Salvia splendens]